MIGASDIGEIGEKGPECPECESHDTQVVGVDMGGATVMCGNCSYVWKL